MISDLFRKDLMDIKPYPAAKPYPKIKLDANESPYTLPDILLKEIANEMLYLDFERYPDGEAKEVCEAYAAYVGVNPNFVMAGNGSDELIQIITNTFIDNGDKVFSLSPSFSMYSYYTKIAGGVYLDAPLDENFKLDVEAFISKICREKGKLVFISNPNNPTGSVIAEEDLLRIVESVPGIVIIDEAYFEFYGKTMLPYIQKYDNLILLRTCSKACASAAIRLGFLITSEKLLTELKKVKPPYNVNTVTQKIGKILLNHRESMESNKSTILKERDYLLQRMVSLKNVECFPTEANFFLIRLEEADKIYKALSEEGILVRRFKEARLKEFLRITVGSRQENDLLLSCLKARLEGEQNG